MSLRRVEPNTIRARVALIVAVGATLACQGPGTEARRTIEAFIEAVQTEDARSLSCLLAGLQSDALGVGETDRKAALADWLADRLHGYTEGRDVGWVEPRDDGVALVRLLALGRGTFYEVPDVELLSGGAVRARMRLRFGYASTDLSGFPPGTTLYFCGAPPGRVEAVRVPERGEVRARVLESLALDWVLVPNGPDCGPSLAIASVQAVAGSEREESVVWVF
jgi:hypothetical protein